MKANEVNLKDLQEINIEQELESVVSGSGTYADIEEAVNNKVISLLTDNFGNVVGISYNSGKTGIEDAVEGLKFEKRFYGHDVLAYVHKALTGNYIYEDMFDYVSSEEDFDDFPKLTDLAKGKVFTAYFGNHESCDFSYDSTKDTLIQKYYDPADTFKYKNIKTQTDFEKAVKDDLGDGKITWEKKDSRKPAHLKNEAIRSKKLKEDFNDKLPTKLNLDVEWLDGDINEKNIAKFLREEFGHYLSGKEKPFNFQYNEGDDYVKVTDIKWGRKKY